MINLKIIEGDTLTSLKKMESESIDTIITSPPYWGLRDYGVEGQIGLEPTLEEYLEKMLQITAELKRVLKKSGVCFWTHNDSYQNKSSIMQSYRLILHMIDEQGWILRNVIIWHKPNHMPSSVKDRFTNAYEPVFMLVKNKKYYFDLDAVRVPHKTTIEEYKTKLPKSKDNKTNFEAGVGIIKYSNSESIERRFALGKNPGDVWKIATQPFPEAHFATYPEKLIQPMIKAGCPQWICKKCGKARKKITKTKQEINEWNDEYWWNFLHGTSHTNRFYKQAFKIMKKWMIENNCYDYAKFYKWWLNRKKGKWSSGNLQKGQGNKFSEEIPFPKPEKRLPIQTIGWTNCECNVGWRPGVVLDPFVGSGTTMKVARELGRSAIGIEINPKYVEIIKKRVKWNYGIGIKFEHIKRGN